VTSPVPTSVATAPSTGAPTTVPTVTGEGVVSALPNTGAAVEAPSAGSSQGTMIIAGLTGLAAAFGLRPRRREQ